VGIGLTRINGDAGFKLKKTKTRLLLVNSFLKLKQKKREEERTENKLMVTVMMMMLKALYFVRFS
jgi:hydrogenase-4 membrane subunit HyfE